MLNDGFTISLNDKNNAFYILYPILAQDFSDSRAYPPEEADYLYQGMEDIMNSGGGEIGKIVIQTSLLYYVKAAYAHSKKYYSSSVTSPFILNAVAQINDFVIDHANWSFSSPDEALTDFVNSIGCVPFYWEVLSSKAGYDTSEWRVCS